MKSTHQTFIECPRGVGPWSRRGGRPHSINEYLLSARAVAGTKQQCGREPGLVRKARKTVRWAPSCAPQKPAWRRSRQPESPGQAGLREGRRALPAETPSQKGRRTTEPDGPTHESSPDPRGLSLHWPWAPRMENTVSRPHFTDSDGIFPWRALQSPTLVPSPEGKGLTDQ